MVAIGRLLAQPGEQVVRARIVRRDGEQRLQRGIGVIGAAEEVQRDRFVIAVFGVLGLDPDGLDKVRQGGGMIAEAGIDAAHRVAAERVAGRCRFGIAQRGGGVAVLAHEGEQLGELGAIFALRVERDGLADVLDAGADAAGARFDDPEQEVSLGIAGVVGEQGPGEALRRAEIAAGQRAAGGLDTGGAHSGHAVAAGSL